MIRFFVSSTFRDMHGERQLLHARVLPQVQRYARRLGEYVDICDLRWGIDQEDGADGTPALVKVMDLCLNAIDLCGGHMIVLLGDHYGTRLDKEEAEYFREEWIRRREKDLPEYEVSLTQLELEYGLFHGEKDRCLCFRRSWKGETPKEFSVSEAQRDLIGRIGKEVPVIPYEAEWDAVRGRAVSLSELEASMIRAMEQVVDRACREKEGKDWAELERDEAMAYAQEQKMYFAGREKPWKRLEQYLEEGKHTIAVYGKSGIGKSAFLAQFVCRHEKEIRETGWYITCGRNDQSKTVMDAAVQLIRYVRRVMGDARKEDSEKNVHTEKEAIQYLRKMLPQLDRFLEERNRRALLVLDAVNQLTSLDGESSLDFLYRMKFCRLTVILSSIERPSGSEAELELRDLTEEDIRAIFRRSMYRVGPMAIRSILEPIRQKRDHATPLYLRGVILLLKMHLGEIPSGKNDAIFSHHRRIIERLPETTETLIWEVLRETRKYVGEWTGGEEDMAEGYEEYLGWIAFSRFGLSDHEMPEAFAASQLTWDSSLIHNCRLFLNAFFQCDRQGRWSFTHARIYDAVRVQVPEELCGEQICRYAERIPGLPDVTGAERTMLFYDGVRAALLRERYDLLQKILRMALTWKQAQERKDARSAPEDYTVIWGLAVQSIAAFNREHGDETYRRYLAQFPEELEQILTGALLPTHNQVDPNRRISAKEPADLYAFARTEPPAAVPETFSFMWFLKQLIDVYDDISMHQEALRWMEPACAYTEKQHLRDYPDAERDRLIRIGKLVFYCANKLIKQGMDQRNGRSDGGGRPLTGEQERKARDISDRMLAWYDREIGEDEEILRNPVCRDQCGSFTNNIGQRFNALQQMDRCFPYRFRALVIKAPEVLQQLGFPEEAAEFCGICRIEEPWDHGGIAAEHQKFWRRITGDDISDEKKRGRIAADWQSIAMTYRSLGTDYFYWPKAEPGRDPILFYDCGCRYLELAIALMRTYGFETSGKEWAVMCIRLAGMRENALKYSLRGTEEDRGVVSDLMDAIDVAVTAFRQNAAFDPVEREKLRKTVESAGEILKDRGNWPAEAEKLQRTERQLREE